MKPGAVARRAEHASDAVVGAALKSAIVTAAMVAAMSGSAHAQAAAASSLRPEARLDYLGGPSHAVHVGGGVSVRAGTYVRVGAGAGIAPYDPGDATRAHGDLTARFLLDPFAQARAGVSLGGGVGLRLSEGRTRAFALVLLDVEAGTRRWVPFARAGIGGGPRLAIGLRHRAARGR